MRIIQVMAAAAVVLAATPAAAVVTTITLTGTASGQDNGHVLGGSPFGSVQSASSSSGGGTFGSLNNAAFTLVLRIDDTLGTIDSFPDGDLIYGAGAQSPMTATFTLGAYSYDFGNFSSDFTKAFLSPDQTYGQADERRIRPPMTGVFTNQIGHIDFNLIFATQVFADRAFSEPVLWTRGAGDVGTGNLTLSLQETSGSPMVFVEGPIRNADLDLTFNTLAVVPGVVVEPTAVPEPATWAMMIAGFGLSGAALRRRIARAA